MKAPITDGETSGMRGTCTERPATCTPPKPEKKLVRLAEEGGRGGKATASRERREKGSSGPLPLATGSARVEE